MTEDNKLSRRTIERDLQRGEKFWGTLAREPEVFRILSTEAGYSEETHQECWSVHLKLSGYPRNTRQPKQTPQQVSAIARLDQYDGEAFSRTRSALRYLYPSQLSYIFNGLRAGQGNKAISSVHTYLERIDALKSGSVAERADSRQQDQDAVAMLEAQRIVHPERVTELREWLRVATEEAPNVPAPEPSVYDDADFQALAYRYHALLTNWRGQARIMIKRGDYLLRLGLTESSNSSADDVGTGPDLLSAVRKQLTLRFGPLPQEVIDQLEEATPEELEDIAERLLTAASLEGAVGIAA